MGILGSGLACLTCAGTFFWESASWWGESWADTGRLFRIAHTLATTRGCRRGGVAGAEPPHKGGPNRPDRPEKQWLVVSGQRRRLTYFRVESGLDIVSLLQEVQESSPQYWDAPRGKHLFPRRTRRTASFVRGGRGGARRTAVLSAVEEREVSSGSKSSR